MLKNGRSTVQLCRTLASISRYNRSWPEWVPRIRRNVALTVVQRKTPFLVATAFITPATAKVSMVKYAITMSLGKKTNEGAASSWFLANASPQNTPNIVKERPGKNREKAVVGLDFKALVPGFVPLSVPGRIWRSVDGRRRTRSDANSRPPTVAERVVWRRW